MPRGATVATTGTPSLAGERVDIDLTVAAARLVGEVHGDDHAIAEVQELQRKVEAAREVGGVGDGDHDVGLAGEQRVSCRPLVADRPSTE